MTPGSDGTGQVPRTPGFSDPLHLRPAFRSYVLSHASAYLPGGAQAVLFPWLVAIVLAADAAAVGVAQMAGQLPMLALVLYGGVIADRFDPRRILITAHLCAMLPPLALAAAITLDRLDYSLLIAFAVATGTINALSLPARDALLSRVAGDELQRGISVATGIQFGTQIGGYVIASFAERLGPAPIFAALALLLGLGALAAMRLPAATTEAVDGAHSGSSAAPDSDPGGAPRGTDGLLSGVRFALTEPAIRPALLVVMGMGVFYAGSFMVLLPLLMRDVYQGGADEIAFVYTAMMLGTLVSIAILITSGGLARPGRGLLLASGLGSVVLGSLCLGPPIAVVYVTVFVWGMLGGVAITSGRSIVQEMAPASHRARVLAVYSLANLGGIPLGSLLLGFVVARIGAQQAALLPGVAMLVICTALGFGSGLWQQQSPSRTATNP